MKKWILVAIFVIMVAAYFTVHEVNYLNEQSICVDCHDFNHQDKAFFQRHLIKNITCIDCHSNGGTKGYVDARKELIYTKLMEKSVPLLKIIIQNDSYNINIIHFKANCIKCHTLVKSKYYNHTNLIDCNKCHSANGTIGFPETGSLQKMGTGGHRNKTCEDCHYIDFRIPKCNDCHKPHKEKTQWDNRVCLDCHNSPHIPVLNGAFNNGISEENCSICHENSYRTLIFYNSKHNELNSCVNCHPVHKEKKQCFECHAGNHISHPFAENNCNACHSKASCSDCHKDPHAPFSGLPRINSKDQFNEYAKNH